MKIFLSILLLSIGTLGAQERGTGERENGRTGAQRPNIILCMGDDHGWEETGYNGHPHLQTPVLDEMAATGLRLDRFYSAHPSCSPTRGSFMTGRHPNRYGTFTPGCSIRPEEITIAHIAAQAGYRTGHFGKWHLGPVKKASPTNPGAMGFDEYTSHDNFFELDPHFSRNGGPPRVYEGESSAIVVDEARAFINNCAAQEKPFLAVLWFGSPHEPYQAYEDDLALYEDLPEEYNHKEVRLTSNETGLQTKRPQRPVLAERFAEITAMDRAIGTLRKHLRKKGLRENTLLFYCGDNGTPREGIITDTLREQKGSIYDGGIRVPGVLEWPAGIPKPMTSSVTTTTSDLLPTLASLTGQPLPGRPLDGIDLLPLFEGKMQQRPEPAAFWSYDIRTESKAGFDNYIDPELQKGTTPLVKLSGGIPTRNFRNYRHPKIEPWNFGGHRALIDGPWKLHLRGLGDDIKTELYHLHDDPAETTDLAEEKEALVKKLTARLHDWQDSVLQSLTEADYDQ